MLTDAQFQAWLDSDTAIPRTLYHLGAYSTVRGVEETRRLANGHFPGADPATPYAAGVAANPVLVEAITLDGAPRVSAGEMKVWNLGGERDEWLDDVFKNRDFLAYVGDERWAFSDYRLVYVGTIDDLVETQGEPTITIKLRDVMERLNVPMTEQTYADGSICLQTFGEACNITPKLVGTDYDYHTGPVEGLIEARVDGKKRTAVTSNPTAATLTLTTNLGPGALTASVQGDKTGGVYRTTIGSLIRMIVQNYGVTGKRFTEAEIDAASFDAFELANQQAVGLHLKDRTLVVDACARLASSVRAQLVPSLTGKLRLIKCRVPASATDTIDTTQYETRTLSVVSRAPVAGAMTIGYCRNYTQQPSLQTTILPEHKALFAAEWREARGKRQATLDLYRLSAVAPRVETCLLNPTDAQAECEARLDEDSVPRRTYSVLGTRSLMLQQLGQAVILYGNELGLQAGKVGQIRLREIDLGNYTVRTEVTA